MTDDGGDGAPPGAGLPDSGIAARGVVGWDIGGVNTKVARVAGGCVLAARAHPYEVQRDPDALTALLAALAVEIGARAGDAHAVTMTAELSQMFRTKRDGVAFVLDALVSVFPASAVRVYAVDGRFLAPDEARREPLAVAAANWAATGRLVALVHPDALLLDTGTTTTDIVPIVGGVLVALGRTDPERLAAGELAYTGALRTPAEAIASHVPLGGTLAGVSGEGFAIAGDVHLWRGDLAPGDYTVPTPDGRPATREFAGERLARVVCADREMLDDTAVSVIADALANAQVARIAEAVARVRARHPSIRTAIVSGVGAFLAAAAARSAGLDVVPLAAAVGADAARCAPAAAVALLLEQARGAVRAPVDQARPAGQTRAVTERAMLDSPRAPVRTVLVPAVVSAVVKIGGGVLRHPEHFGAVVDAAGAAARHHRLLIVPGGGPFADAVRATDRRIGLSDSAAHWMAVLAMDQYAHLLASRLLGGVIVTSPHEVAVALDAGALPVLAPSRWLRECDPLPHSWDVTSDSIAAWVAGAIGAPCLVLVKPPGVASANIVDGYFARALPTSVTHLILSADRIGSLRSVLRDGIEDR